MTIQDTLDFLESAQYKHMMMSMLWATTIGYLALIAIAVVLYVRLRKLSIPVDAQSLIIATLFDSFILSLAYVAIELVFLADRFRHEAKVIDSWIAIEIPLLSLGFRWAVYLFIAYVVVNRLQTLSQWLTERAKNE